MARKNEDKDRDQRPGEAVVEKPAALNWSRLNRLAARELSTGKLFLFPLSL